ncbi:MAG: hypothetical protein ACRC4M_05840, partial [Mycoplasma sp.]
MKYKKSLLSILSVVGILCPILSLTSTTVKSNPVNFQNSKITREISEPVEKPKFELPASNIKINSTWNKNIYTNTSTASTLQMRGNSDRELATKNNSSFYT